MNNCFLVSFLRQRHKREFESKCLTWIIQFQPSTTRVTKHCTLMLIYDEVNIHRFRDTWSNCTSSPCKPLNREYSNWALINIVSLFYPSLLVSLLVHSAQRTSLSMKNALFLPTLLAGVFYLVDSDSAVGIWMEIHCWENPATKSWQNPVPSQKTIPITTSPNTIINDFNSRYTGCFQIIVQRYKNSIS